MPVVSSDHGSPGVARGLRGGGSRGGRLVGQHRRRQRGQAECAEVQVLRHEMGLFSELMSSPDL